MSDKPYVSPTQLDMACRCGEQYRRRYIEGEVIPPGIAIIKGKAFHHGAKVNFRQKLETHRDLPVNEIVEAAREEFDDALHGEFILSEEESKRGASVVLGEAIDDAMSMMTAHAKLQAPDYQPVLVEEKIRIELPNAPRDVLGIIDLADDQHRVVDFKTSGRAKSQADVDDSVQLTVYAAAFQSLTGTPPVGVRLDTIVQTKRDTYRQALDSERGESDFTALANRINVVTSMIEAGIFLPAVPGAWWCSPKWCGYWSTCPYVNSQRRALAQQSE